ncbi:hypothetical protein LPJ61_002507 [Coemansia biformis]|uniref:Uncharacterized protein n=1 Tax=Coemansia biformis TaxID=1286918 RepID=A0A9W7YD76_9FUNG|nr:hypothetical protein LPJ61_002507 [Coemansia biformis]
MTFSRMLHAHAVYLGRTRCLPSIHRAAAPAVARRFYVPKTSGGSAASAHPNGAKLYTPDQLLDAKRPTKQNEALASIIDGELDYDTDMGAVAVNNAEAQRRAELEAKADKIAEETNDDFAKRHFL